MTMRRKTPVMAASFMAACLGASALTPAIALAAPGAELTIQDYSIAPQSLQSALIEFSRQSQSPVVASTSLIRGLTAPALQGRMDEAQALKLLLADSDLRAIRGSDGGWAISRKADTAPQSGSAAGGGAEVEALIVTAQKKEEAIQDVPIAISAFTQKSLEEQKIEGGFDLVKAIPNVSFSKNNFSGYNFSIRGIGTKAVSVTTDPGVAVSFNNVTMIRNRLFEQEYFDLERVEVLRGPQGTLYGRNATSGVINVISAKPDLNEFSGMIKGEVGNYHAKRISGTVNVPLISDVLGVRLAGAATVRDGYGVNLYDNSSTDGRDLWSVRLTLAYQPTDALRADLIWERFEEDDNRSRTGKQLCTHDPSPASIGGVDMTIRPLMTRGRFTQGCLPGSLYDDAAFGTPNGMAIPFVLALELFGIGLCDVIGPECEGNVYALRPDTNPYGDQQQSRNLRELYSQLKPVYRAQADVLELNIDFDLTDALTLSSQTLYNKDRIYSSQDFNRYTTLPVIGDSNNALAVGRLEPSRHNITKFSPGGIFCDPQLGCSDTIVGMDISRARSQQFSQEFRIQSAFDGPLNFSSGIGYTRYRTVEDYYVFFNGITMAAMTGVNANTNTGGRDLSKATTSPDCDLLLPSGFPDGLLCTPIETNPIDQLQDVGHNYFLSRNPYRLTSKAAFGELYWEVADQLKLTAGFRYTDDKKVFTPIPSQVLLTDPARLDPFRALPGGDRIVSMALGLPFFSFASGYYPAMPDVEKGWKEVTGRIGFDWKPDLAFTDQTMLYAFYSRGYKGGGMNPPLPGLNYEGMEAIGIQLTPSAPPVFRPEFVNAYEIGAKNTLMGGAMTLNLGAFYYDYKDYQVSKIVDRSANNENFDARIWGAEIEALFQPTRNLRFNAGLGYLDTELAEGSQSIDIMNRTVGRTDWVIVKPALTLMSNCIAPAALVARILTVDGPDDRQRGLAAQSLCPGGDLLGENFRPDDPRAAFAIAKYGFSYDPRDHPEANYGAGFFSDVSGHELPNSPHWTVTLGGQYSYEFLEGWKATVRGDFYWQSQQWARIYQLPIDKIHAWKNGNLSLLIERPDDGLAFELYAKNIFDDTPITDTFTNSDDTALTTNIFVLDPRLLGLSIKKTF